MIYKLKELFLIFVIKLFHKMEKLTTKEKQVQKIYLSKLQIAKRKTEKPIIVAMVGLVGSGKTSVARKIAEMIGGTIIVADDIRIHLRKLGEKFEKTRAISENIALEIIKQGGNLVLDSDFIDDKKRTSLKDRIKKGTKLIFIRTYCERDIMIERIIRKLEEKFFKDAKSQSSGINKGQIVKFREMWRRTPHHYEWVSKAGGNWILKRLPFKVINIDTTNEKKWPIVVKKELAIFIKK
ncbi:AAA family ATPase [Patescibacteria group bacterium]|nr:AAA family ATPase [Patescibacteria group bacterium]